jgi:signal transduction histidine kinase
MVLLFNAAKALAPATDVDHLLAAIVAEVRTVLYCEGAGVLLHDEDRDDFYWRTVQDQEEFLSSAKSEIRIPKSEGVCGWVFGTGLPALVNDAANDPRLYRQVEDKSGFITRNMVCVPLNAREKRLGVVYALNKIGGSFTDQDVEVMTALGGYTALALENASYYEKLIKSHKELERLDRVKSKILNHLSHELKTPLAIIEASLRVVERRLQSESVDVGNLPLERIHRNVSRLKTIERQVGHIVDSEENVHEETTLGFIDFLIDHSELLGDDSPGLIDVLGKLKNRIIDTFPSNISESEVSQVTGIFRAAQFLVTRMKQDRILDLEFETPEPATFKIQPHILTSALDGLIRNAVENTPDHGRITVQGRYEASNYLIRVIDHGIGIPETEQANIFEGFYPVQETDMYSSGQRYAFNAGGTGTDLLKIKIFASRFGFDVSFISRRCSHIPTPRDQCPGSIAECTYCESVENCMNNGGTEFVITVPSGLIIGNPDNG